jgi:hypothetical protein
MRFVGKDVYIQQGENWTLDFECTNEKGDPLQLLKYMDNPYIAITVTAARYAQKGDFRVTYWLDLKTRYVEKENGDIDTEPIKTFISTEALYLPMTSPTDFSIDEALSIYGKDVGGSIVLDKSSDFDITNYLFVSDPNNDGKYIYKYVSSYTTGASGNVTSEVWETYSFRVIKTFDTRDWVEQGYLYDIKILAGESLKEYVIRILQGEQYDTSTIIIDDLSDTELQYYINSIKSKEHREYAQAVFDEGMPLMPSYDTKSILLEPSNIYVSTNIQGGIS